MFSSRCSKNLTVHSFVSSPKMFNMNTSQAEPYQTNLFFKFIFLVIAMLLLSRVAWMCDDAYITFRVVDNFINGYGLRWNIDERVQVYTNPLWMLLISGFYALTREMYFTSLIVSMVISCYAIYIVVFKLARSQFVAILAILVLFSSKAFSHYTVSGLENPLTFLFIALFFHIYLNRDSETSPHRTLFWLSFICALAMVNRIDSGILFIPTLLTIGWRYLSWRTLGIFIIGFIPLVLWELFSLIYYGFLFPNTAYAKLGGGVPHYKFVVQGLIYLVESFLRDPLTLFVIITALILPLWTRRNTLYPLVFGLLLSVIYVVNVGGDFMSGRFLSAPMLLATIILVQFDWKNLSLWEKLTHKLSVTLFMLCLLSTVAYLSPINWLETPYEITRSYILKTFPDYFLYVPHSETQRQHWLGKRRRMVIFNISDERYIYYPMTGLWRVQQGIEMPNHFWAHEGKQAQARGDKISIQGGCGFFGFYAGTTVHVIDVFGLVDPLLARSPPILSWRIGHLERHIPEGYLDSILQKRNLITDPKIAAQYEELKLVTRGDLFEQKRWEAILRLNFGL